MKVNRVKARLKEKKIVIGSFLPLPSARLAEFVAICGFDFVVIDQEHAPINIETAEEMVRACELTEATPIVRVGGLEPHSILQALDIGAMGVHIPCINTAGQAEQSVKLCKYSPLGNRGLAGVRAAGYGLQGSLADYCRDANEQTMVIIHIEEIEAIRNLDALLAVDGVDVYYIGPTDLSNSLGQPGNTGGELPAIVDNALRKIVAAGKTAGIITNDREAARRYVAKGVRYLATQALGLMASTSREFLKQVREEAA